MNVKQYYFTLILMLVKQGESDREAILVKYFCATTSCERLDESFSLLILLLPSGIF